METLTDQLRDWLAAGKDREGAAGAIAEHVIGIDAEAAVDRREQAVAVHRPLDWVFGPAAGGADCLAHPQAATGGEDAHCARPVVAARPAAGILIADERRAAELAAEEHEHVPVETAGVDVLDERGDGVIDLPRTRAMMPDRPDDAFLKPDDIARTVIHLIEQPRSAWTFELDVRPFGEKW